MIVIGKPSWQNKFALSIKQHGGLVERRRCGGGDISLQQKQCTERHFFLIITIKADKQAAKAEFSQLWGRMRQCLRITLRLQNIANGEIRWLFSQPIRELFACLLLSPGVSYSPAPYSSCLWKTGVNNALHRCLWVFTLYTDITVRV